MALLAGRERHAAWSLWFAVVPLVGIVAFELVLRIATWEPSASNDWGSRHYEDHIIDLAIMPIGIPSLFASLVAIVLGISGLRSDERRLRAIFSLLLVLIFLVLQLAWILGHGV